MSSKPKNAHGDHEYLRAAIEEKGECEHAYDVVVTAAISLRSVRAVLCIRLEARITGCSETSQPLCSYEVEWPNAGTLGWAATIYNAHVRLSRLVEDSLADWDRE